MAAVTTCREQIVQAVYDILNTLCDAANAKLDKERNRRAAITDDELGDWPLLILFEDQERPENDFSSEDAYVLPLAVQGTIKGSGTEAAQRVNALKGIVQRAMAADLTIGGRARDLQFTDGSQWLSTDSDSGNVEGFMLAFEIAFATREGDPFTFENA